ncbi:Hsp70 family protein [Oxalobacteraceae bacterium R-40]|uniref:Hsp70 family protein n=1 Tax=Keguizhuia sedimenti TaxID=3064264 RepID=A0ABU1BN41_9BURK|nr:Hsp70 family protein [Oxalobacteraceae bacterium R-40]
MKRFAVGIDLGTTHTAVAYAAPGSDDIHLFDIEQLVAPGEVKASSLLPSLRFHAAAGELDEADLQLPWTRLNAAEQEPVVIGRLARTLGAQVPGRLVASAKSWLSHGAVDRMEPILPWGASPDVPKVSPVDASASYLAYVRAAWNWRFPQHPLEQQEIVLTVPASFDEAARALTVKAAQQAGLPHLRLLEEPQAAFYDWLFRHRDSLAADLAQTRLILVCDVGGGTTDFSLIKVAMHGNEVQITRIGVGKHLMLGGDNMDLVLAHIAERRMADGQQDTRRLSAARISQLIERCRAAKEELLGSGAPDKTMVTLLGSGSSLVGGARSVELTKDEIEQTIVDGFFPMVGSNEKAQQRRSGIVEFGLPYASDAAITRHLASFLAQHAGAASEALGIGEPGQAGLAMPDTLLLNGGVFRAPVLAKRLEHTLGAWRGQPLRLLDNADPDVAVARGAVAYSLGREGLAPRIGGGSPRSYFLLLDHRRDKGKGRGTDESQLSPTHAQGVCVLPRGSEQGTETVLHNRVFALRLGQPVRFHLVSSTADKGTAPLQPGDLIDLDDADIVRLPPIATVLGPANTTGTQEVPVQLAASITEVGTLEMHCVSTTDPSQRWLLEFQLREVAQPAAAGGAAGQEALPANFAEAIAQIDRIFGTRPQAVMPKEVRQLRTHLEKLMGSRESWHTPLLRRLFDALLQRSGGRRRSVDHERAWLNLTGYCLRPGFGDPVDRWRIERLWSLFEAGVHYRKDIQVCSEWWTMWRRVAGGLGREEQLRVLEDFALNVHEEEVEPQERPANLVKGSRDDMLRVAASLERIPANYKVEIGDWLLDELNKTAFTAGTENSAASPAFWALARIGARQPFYGSAHDVVPPDIAAAWLERIMVLDWKRTNGAAFAAAHIARLTGDRARDLPPELRERAAVRLSSFGSSSNWITMVQEVVELDEISVRGFLADSLPPGLKLLS